MAASPRRRPRSVSRAVVDGHKDVETVAKEARDKASAEFDNVRRTAACADGSSAVRQGRSSCSSRIRRPSCPRDDGISVTPADLRRSVMVEKWTSSEEAAPGGHVELQEDERSRSLCVRAFVSHGRCAGTAHGTSQANAATQSSMSSRQRPPGHGPVAASDRLPWWSRTPSGFQIP